MAVKIYPAARNRILEIWDYTEERWGEKKADEYVNGLLDAINRAEVETHRWRPVVDEFVQGAYFIRFSHHLIFFRVLPKGNLGVVSILHENMDIPARLREDSGAPSTPKPQARSSRKRSP